MLKAFFAGLIWVIGFAIVLAMIALVMCAVCWFGDWVYTNFGIGGTVLLGSFIVACGLRA